MSVVIKNFKAYDKGNLRGFLDVQIPAWNTTLEIRGCKVMTGQYGEFVSLPSREYEHEGQTKYAPLIEIADENIKKHLQKALNHAWKEYRAVTSAPAPAPAPAPVPPPQAGYGSSIPDSFIDEGVPF